MIWYKTVGSGMKLPLLLLDSCLERLDELWENEDVPYEEVLLNSLTKHIMYSYNIIFLYYEPKMDFIHLWSIALRWESSTSWTWYYFDIPRLHTV